MELKYKNFVLKKDDYCWTIIELKEYDKLDKLGGTPTGEKGIKEEIHGYYPLNLEIVLVKLSTLLVQDVETIEQYLSEYRNITQELKEFINDCITQGKK